MLYVAIFLIFAPIGLLVALVQPEAWGWGAGLVSAAFAGLNAILWANAITNRRWWLLAVAVVLPFIAPWVYFAPMSALGVYRLGVEYSEGWRRVILAVQAVVFLSFGFTVLVAYIRRSEAVSARARAELELAGRMHDSIVPEINRPGVLAHVIGVSVASSEMGGDLIDLVEHPSGVLDMVVADVSGHGVGAGLVMGMVKGAVRTRLLAGGELSDLAGDVNRVLSALTRAETFVTAAFLRLSPDRTLTFTLAGHLPIYLRRADGIVDTLDNESLPLGVTPDETFADRKVGLRAGDTIVVFTDGLMEVQNARGEQLGLATLRDVIAAHGGGSPASLREALFKAARDHGVPTDDQSMLVVRIA